MHWGDMPKARIADNWSERGALVYLMRTDPYFWIAVDDITTCGFGKKRQGCASTLEQVENGAVLAYSTDKAVVVELSGNSHRFRGKWNSVTHGPKGVLVSPTITNGSWSL
jgi:hypothetical protein